MVATMVVLRVKACLALNIALVMSPKCLENLFDSGIA